MPTDIASLKIAIDSKDLKLATTELNKLAKQGAWTEKATDRLNTSSKKSMATFSLWNTQTLVLTASIGYLTNSYIKNADAMTNVNSKLKLVTKSSKELEKTQKDIFKVSQETSTSFTANIDLYQKMGMATKELNLSQKEMINLVDMVSKSMIVSGTDAAQAATLVTQLGQAFSSDFKGVGQELGTIRDQSTALYQAILKGSGKTSQEFRKAAENGEISSQIIIDALKSQKDAMEEDYKKMTKTVEHGIRNISNSAVSFVGKLDEITGATASLSNGLRDTSKFFDENSESIIDYAKNVALVGASIGGATLALKGYSAVSTAVTTSNFLMSSSYRALTIQKMKATAATRALSLSMKAIPFVAVASAISVIIESMIGSARASDELEESLSKTGKSLLELSKNQLEYRRIVLDSAFEDAMIAKNDAIRDAEHQSWLESDKEHAEDQVNKDEAISKYEEIKNAYKSVNDALKEFSKTQNEINWDEQAKAFDSFDADYDEKIVKASELTKEQKKQISLTIKLREESEKRGGQSWYDDEIEALQKIETLKQNQLDLQARADESWFASEVKDAEEYARALEKITTPIEKIDDLFSDLYETIKDTFDTKQMEKFGDAWAKERKDAEKGNEKQEDSLANQASATAGLANAIGNATGDNAELQKAMQITALLAGGIAVMEQGKGDQYTAFARMAAMAVNVSGILTSSGVSGSISTSSSIAESSNMEEFQIAKELGGYTFDDFIDGLDNATEALEEMGNVGTVNAIKAEEVFSQYNKYIGGVDYLKNILEQGTTSEGIFGTATYQYETAQGTKTGLEYQVQRTIEDWEATAIEYMEEFDSTAREIMMDELEFTDFSIAQLTDMTKDFNKSIATTTKARIDEIAILVKQGADIADYRAELEGLFTEEHYRGIQDFEDALEALTDNNASIYEMMDAINGTNKASEYELELALKALGLQEHEIDSKSELNSLLEQQLMVEGFLEMSREEQIETLGKQQKAEFDKAQAEIDNKNAVGRAEIQQANSVITAMNAIGASIANMTDSAFEAVGTLSNWVDIADVEAVDFTGLVSGDIEDLETIANVMSMRWDDAANSASDAADAAQKASDDIAKAASDLAKAIADEKTSLEEQLARVGLTNIELRELDILKIYESNRAIQREIWAREDSIQSLIDSEKAIKDAVSLWVDTQVDGINKTINAHEDSQGKLNDILSETTSNISLLESVFDSLGGVISQLRGEALGTEYTLDSYNKSMSESLRLYNSGDYEDFQNSVSDTISQVGVLSNTDLYETSNDMKFAQLVAAKQFETMEDYTLKEIDYLEQIANNTEEQIEKLVLLIEALTSDIQDLQDSIKPEVVNPLSSETAFISSLYEGQGQDMTAADLAYWLGDFESGQSEADVANSISKGFSMPNPNNVDAYDTWKVNGYADGGVSTSAQMALVSEGSYSNEAHVPLPDGRAIPVNLGGNNMFKDMTNKIGNLESIMSKLLVNNQDQLYTQEQSLELDLVNHEEEIA